MSKKETISRTITVALTLCIVCSLVVAGAAVLLKERQNINKKIDLQSNILAAAGLLEPGKSIAEQFQQVETRLVDINTGKFSELYAVEDFKQLDAAKDSSKSMDLNGDQDLAKISRRENFALVYLIRKDNVLDKIILPIRGYGLWSTLHGFLALENDANTISGLGFYQHGETPGLGGEVDNPKWKSIWHGKKVYQGGDVKVHLIKGSVDAASSQADYQIDGLAGATLTSRGVTNLVHFWLGDLGFKKFLTNLKAGEA